MRKILRSLTFLSMLLLAFTSNAQISGSVFRDLNANGSRETGAGFNESGVQGITVTAYTASGTILGTAATDAAGSFSFTSGVIAPGTKVRLIFSGWESVDYAAAFGNNNKTATQFHTAPSTTANFGIQYPMDYVKGTNPNVAVASMVNGSSALPASAGVLSQTPNADATIFTFPYNNSGTTNPTVSAKKNETGSIWGLAYQRHSKSLFAAAFVKRHAGLKNGKKGAIYLTNLSGVPATSEFIDLEAAPYNINLGGTVVSDAVRGLTSVSNPNPSIDKFVYSIVGLQGLGAMDLSDNDDQRFLYVTNTFSNTLIKIDLGTGATPTAPSAAGVQEFGIPSVPVSINSVVRPFAVKVHRGKVYVGAVSTNENAPLPNMSNTGMNAYVFEFYPATNTFNSTPVLTFPLNYTRGILDKGAAAPLQPLTRNWYPWQTNPASFSTNKIAGDYPMLPQPILSNIEFGEDGAMIIGLMDRWGHQMGFKNVSPNNTSTFSPDGTLYNAIAAGDILRAHKTGATWTLENNGSSGSLNGGVGNGQGPGGGEFFSGDNFVATLGGTTDNHQETHMGGLAYYHGKREVMNTAMDPLRFFSGGTKKLSNINGGRLAGTEYELYNGFLDHLWGKANGLGDIVLLSDPAPIEIGNRVWMDSDGDGEQDADEDPISGVDVELVKGGSVIATATTDANGEYYFSSDPTRTSTANARYNITGLTPNSNFIVRVPRVQGGSKQAALGTNELTIANNTSGSDADEIDNDGVLNGDDADAPVTTGINGANNHSCDFGFKPFGVSSGGGGGVESYSLGNIIAKRTYAQAKSGSLLEPNYRNLRKWTSNDLMQAGGLTQNSNTNSNSVQALSLTALVPSRLTDLRLVAFNTTPADLVQFTNAKEVLAIDYVKDNIARAVAFATRTSGEVYNHTKPICDRLKGAQLLAVEQITVNNTPLIAYTIRNPDGKTEYAVSFTAGQSASRNNIRIQSNWFSKNIVGDDMMYNFQLWAESTTLLSEMATSVLNNLKQYAPLNSSIAPDMPNAYIKAGRRVGGNLFLTVVNKTAATGGYFTYAGNDNEQASSITRNIPFTMTANGETVITVPVADALEANISMYTANNSLEDMVYLADGAWGIDYNSSTTTISNYAVKNDPNRIFKEESPLMRNVSVKAVTSDYLVIYKMLNGGAMPRDVSAFNTLRFTAAGTGTLRITLVKKSITNWADQYSITVPASATAKEYQITLNSFKSAGINSPINAKDIVQVLFSFEVANKNTNLNASISNAAFVNTTATVNTPAEDTRIRTYPNPSNNGRFTVTFKSPVDQQVTMNFRESGTGRILHTMQHSAVKGDNVVSVDMSSKVKTSPQLLIVQITGTEGTFSPAKTVVQKQ
ncbi:MAG: hypothetical protein J0L83_00365 [Chitinophagales bacterium]|nr:hypothetical protein [Chitinophagales bacterium]